MLLYWIAVLCYLYMAHSNMQITGPAQYSESYFCFASLYCSLYRLLFYTIDYKL